MGAINDFIIKTLKTHQAIKWAGGDCPVGLDQSVIVEHRRGLDNAKTRGKFSLGTAKNYRWKHSGDGSDVMAFVVVERGTSEKLKKGVKK